MASLDSAHSLAPAFRLFIPGNFEDAFIYMGTLLAVTTEHEIISLNYDSLVDSTVTDRDLHPLTTLFLRRNDWLDQEGTRQLLAEPSIAHHVRQRIGSIDEWLAVPENFGAQFEYERLLGRGILLDLQIYNQRLFAGTTNGMVQASFLTDTESGELEFSAPHKRTDARCMSLNIRYGAVAASCGPDGLLISFDEFQELSYSPSRELESVSVNASIRSSWLGYHLINYDSAIHSQALRSNYQQVPGGHRNVVVTGLRADESLIAPERAGNEDDVDFTYNAHSTFFTHRQSGNYVLRRRQWSRGRLGGVESSHEGFMQRPLSTHEAASGFIAETYDAVYLLNERGASLLHSGETIAVRTFPHSKRYQNLILIVSEDGIHLVSPLNASVLGG